MYAYATPTGCRHAPQQHLQIDDAKFDSRLSPHSVSRYMKSMQVVMSSGRHRQYARDCSDRYVQPSVLVWVIHGVRHEEATLGRPDAMQLDWCVAEQRGIQWDSILEEWLLNYQLCSPCNRV